MPRPRRSDPRRITSERLGDAYVALSTRLGRSEVTLRELAQELGVTHQSIWHHARAPEFETTLGEGAVRSLELPDVAGLSPRAAVRRLVAAIAQGLVTRPLVARKVAAVPLRSIAWDRFVEPLAEAIPRETPREDRVAACRMLLHLAVGSALSYLATPPPDPAWAWLAEPGEDAWEAREREMLRGVDVCLVGLAARRKERR